MSDKERKIEEFGTPFVPKLETPEKVLKGRISHRAKIEGQVKHSKEKFTPTVVSGINKINIERVLKNDIPDDETMPLWKNGKLTGSVIKKVWDLIDRDLIIRLAEGWKIKPKPGYNKTIYYINKKGDCSCQGYKVRRACSHALAVDVFVRLNQMGCVE
tara:strand:+ start:204 stop:677 length:474 start_codon:yes stop_codon:yes gene_type:complete